MISEKCQFCQRIMGANANFFNGLQKNRKISQKIAKNYTFCQKIAERMRIMSDPKKRQSKNR